MYQPINCPKAFNLEGVSIRWTGKRLLDTVQKRSYANNYRVVY